MKDKTVFTVLGDTGVERARALREALESWRRSPQSRIDPVGEGETAINIIVTGATRDTSMEHAVSYACSELVNNIAEGGGSIWDGTHVQITLMTEDG